MLRKIRIILAAIFFIGISLLILDFTGTLHTYFSWMAKVQLAPAILSLNIAVILGLLILTLLFGRVYCSVICPLGTMQDIFARMGGFGRKNRFKFSPAKNILRIVMLVLFIVFIVLGLDSLWHIMAPYSTYSQMLHALVSPIYRTANNALAYFAERADSYAFYKVEVIWYGALIIGVNLAVLVIIGGLAWFGGRTWCNTICPVGTVLGFISKLSWFKPVIDVTKCNGCTLCSRNCKASCIDAKKHKIDYSRCVACMNCISTCKHGAISFTCRRSNTPEIIASQGGQGGNPLAEGRRNFLSMGIAVVAGSLVARAQNGVDGGLAEIEDKQKPERQTPLTPPGSKNWNNFTRRCIACELCISECPSGILKPSTEFKTFMQPVMDYTNGYCRPECNKCSQVCPTGAILPLDLPEKVSTQIGKAVWIEHSCIIGMEIEGEEIKKCGNCARHCPNGAIEMMAKDPDDPDSLKFPVINPERCIGCGACEYVCPARPFTAIYVEGLQQHKLN